MCGGGGIVKQAKRATGAIDAQIRRTSPAPLPRNAFGGATGAFGSALGKATQKIAMMGQQPAAQSGPSLQSETPEERAQREHDNQVLQARNEEALATRTRDRQTQETNAMQQTLLGAPTEGSMGQRFMERRRRPRRTLLGTDNTAPQ